MTCAPGAVRTPRLLPRPVLCPSACVAMGVRFSLHKLGAPLADNCAARPPSSRGQVGPLSSAFQVLGSGLEPRPEGAIPVFPKPGGPFSYSG